MGPERVPTTPDTGAPDGNRAVFSTAVADTTLSEALITLRKRRWVLVAAVILGLIYGVYKAVTQPKVYESYGRIEVRTGSSNEYRVSAIQGGQDSSNKLLTEVAILNSDSLMLNV